MHSLRTKMMMLTVCVILIAVTVVALLSVLYIQNNEHRQSDQMLLLMHDLHAQTDLALGEKDRQIQTLERSLDSLRQAVQSVKEQQDSLAAASRDSLQAPSGAPTDK